MPLVSVGGGEYRSDDDATAEHTSTKRWMARTIRATLMPLRRTTTSRAVASIAAALALSLLAGCADDTGADRAVGTGGESGTATQADVAFVTGMIAYHGQAVVMAGLADERSDRDDLLELADRIESIRVEQVEEMADILERFDAPSMDGEMGEMVEMIEDGEMGEMTGGMSMEGMLSREEMDALADAEGEEFDARFLEGMIAHHQGAIADAEQVLVDGEDEKVAELAEDVIAAQETGIERMSGWQEAWDLAA